MLRTETSSLLVKGESNGLKTGGGKNICQLLTTKLHLSKNNITMPRLHKYREVKKLPDNALTVSQYAKERGCTTPYIYELVKKGKAEFELVTFKGINFIIPN